MGESALQLNRWTPARKAAVVLELLRGDAAEMARRHGLSQAQLFAWRDRFLEGGQAALKTRRARGEQEHERRARELERKVGHPTDRPDGRPRISLAAPRPPEGASGRGRRHRHGARLESQRHCLGEHLDQWGRLGKGR
ncbi:MAG: transposase [Candidatus Methylomirabilales bacterium]